mgnify:CR=1 FL=1
MIHINIRQVEYSDIPRVSQMCVRLAELEGKMRGREPSRDEVRSRVQREIKFDHTCAYFVA